MELQKILETTGTCRFYARESVPAAALGRILDAARYAPSGGNRHPVRLIAVRDPEKRRQLAAWYLPLWKAYLKNVRAADPGAGKMPTLVANADHFAEHLAEVPVLIVVCAVLADLYATDRGLGRLSIVGGASVYPAVQNLLLKAREEGFGTALTTLLCAEEERVRELLAIPQGVVTAALVALGKPERGFPRRLRRRPLAEVAFAEGYGQPLGAECP
ncbi:MAG TPA: nitroreductase family protein [Myxococcota bacterium]|nr:nitroreductase family protein [Myxococcota bacterium]